MALILYFIIVSPYIYMLHRRGGHVETQLALRLTHSYRGTAGHRNKLSRGWTLTEQAGVVNGWFDPLLIACDITRICSIFRSIALGESGGCSNRYYRMSRNVLALRAVLCKKDITTGNSYTNALRQVMLYRVSHSAVTPPPPCLFECITWAWK